MKNTPEVPENTTSPGIKAKFVLLSLIGIFYVFCTCPVKREPPQFPLNTW